MNDKAAHALMELAAKTCARCGDEIVDDACGACRAKPPIVGKPRSADTAFTVRTVKAAGVLALSFSITAMVDTLFLLAAVPFAAAFVVVVVGHVRARSVRCVHIQTPSGDAVAKVCRRGTAVSVDGHRATVVQPLVLSEELAGAFRARTVTEMAALGRALVAAAPESKRSDDVMRGPDATFLSFFAGHLVATGAMDLDVIALERWRREKKRTVVSSVVRHIGVSVRRTPADDDAVLVHAFLEQLHLRAGVRDVSDDAAAPVAKHAPSFFAEFAAACDQDARGFDFDRVYETHASSTTMTPVQVDEIMEPVRSDPEFLKWRAIFQRGPRDLEEIPPVVGFRPALK